MLTVCQRLIREHIDEMRTPFEDLFTNLVFTASRHAVTRSDVQNLLREFDRNWADSVQIARGTYREYSDLVTADQLPLEEDPYAALEEATH